MQSDNDNFIPLLARDGVIVLEGVAGIGKTYSVNSVCRSLRTFPRHPDPTVLTRYLGTLIAGLGQTSKGKYLFRCLGRFDWLSRLNNVITHAGKSKSKQNTLMKALDTLSYLEMLPRLIARLEASVSLGPDQRLFLSLRKAYTATDDYIVTNVLVMHPSVTYEEMIGGYRLQTGDLVWKKGSVLRFIEDARRCQESGGDCSYLLVLDEINRCNLPSVLGELLYLIEPSRRVTLERLLTIDKQVSGLPLPVRSRNRELTHNRLALKLRSGVYAYIPDNLFILGTMNSSDRSILGFDQALRRRFPPYRIEPLAVPEVLARLSARIDDGGLYDVVRAWGAVNALLRWVIGPDAMIGHSYWLTLLSFENPDPDLAWRFGVLPQAIHSAESARQERFLADVFDVNKNGEFLLNSYVRDRDTQLLGEHYAHCFSAYDGDDKDLFDKLIEMVRRPTWGVRLVGQGHGQKLVVLQR